MLLQQKCVCICFCACIWDKLVSAIAKALADSALAFEASGSAPQQTSQEAPPAGVAWMTPPSAWFVASGDACVGSLTLRCGKQACCAKIGISKHSYLLTIHKTDLMCAIRGHRSRHLANMGLMMTWGWTVMLGP